MLTGSSYCIFPTCHIAITSFMMTYTYDYDDLYLYIAISSGDSVLKKYTSATLA